jgi:hypothetical protein
MIANVFLFLCFATWLHPLHLSVSDIHYKPEAGTLEITQRLFADDLEDALRQFNEEKVDVFNPRDPERLEKIIGEYVMEHFALSINEKPVDLNYLGYEREEDAIWVYLEATQVPGFSSLSARNTVFFEMFDDQMNLINVKKDGRIRSLKLSPEQEHGRISY